MASTSSFNPESGNYHIRPNFFLGQHDSDRAETLTDDQYYQVLDAGFSFVTTPITNASFKQRVVELYKSHLEEREQWKQERSLSASQSANASLPVPIVPSITDKDTTLFPSSYVGSLVAYASPWIDLCSSDPLISSISRQVLNLEVGYANWCGVRSIVITGPRSDESGKEVALFARAINELLKVSTRANIIVQMPMYREPGLEEKMDLLSVTLGVAKTEKKDIGEEIDLFSAWDSWHTIRTACTYSMRLFVALRIPKRLPERELQDRWFAEPLHYLNFSSGIFQLNKTGNPSLSRNHQDLLNRYMRLKNAPWMILSDVGPDLKKLSQKSPAKSLDFPSLAEAKQVLQENRRDAPNSYVAYMKYLERSQPSYGNIETPTLNTFQDWLQSPLQPLSDNLESATYEMFEGDPVKYDQYELAITEAMRDWKEFKKPTSSVPYPGHMEPELIVAVAGAGRGPLVTRVLRAAAATGTKIQLWALEKNHNAYVYLLRQNEREWNGQITVVKTDMRGWNGPTPKGCSDAVTGKVDILVTELLGSFGDNELSPECIDGIQRHIARPHGISIPASYTAHLSPISTPRIHADIGSRVSTDPNAFDTPWVVRLFAIDFVAQSVPLLHRFQEAWEFAHPVEVSRSDDLVEEHGMGAKYVTPGVGSMSGANGANEHNARHCHLTFVCRSRGVIHGLAGYFESTLYEPMDKKKELVEISTVPDQIDRKSKDMISWFPIFFPLRQPLYFPQDTELEVSMWRQTDDASVWYEWHVEAYAWIGPNTRIKVGASELHSSRKVACLM
ncbi:methyltransferase-like protein [Coniochaeta sp. 2T2.1]|nr:methyltransferase-like protein [Coniochaeta sp. 2T2.1]